MGIVFSMRQITNAGSTVYIKGIADCRYFSHPKPSTSSWAKSKLLFKAFRARCCLLALARDTSRTFKILFILFLLLLDRRLYRIFFIFDFMDYSMAWLYIIFLRVCALDGCSNFWLWEFPSIGMSSLRSLPLSKTSVGTLALSVLMICSTYISFCLTLKRKDLN